MKKENYSNKQQEFIQNHKRKHHLVSFVRITILVIFLLVWELSARFHLIDSFFFSSPSLLITCIKDLFLHQNLLSHIGITLWETLVSFFFITLISVVVSAILWFFPTLSKCLEPYLVVLNSLPKSALAPLFLVWLGTGFPTIVVAGISVAVFGSVINVYTSFQETDPNKIILLETLGGNRWQTFRYVVFPGALPVLQNVCKVNIGLALVGVIIGEFLAAREGLGYLIIYGSQVFKLSMVISGILILSIIAMLLYRILEFTIHCFKKGRL